VITVSLHIFSVLAKSQYLNPRNCIVDDIITKNSLFYALLIPLILISFRCYRSDVFCLYSSLFAPVTAQSIRKISHANKCFVISKLTEA